MLKSNTKNKISKLNKNLVRTFQFLAPAGILGCIPISIMSFISIIKNIPLTPINVLPPSIACGVLGPCLSISILGKTPNKNKKQNIDASSVSLSNLSPNIDQSDSEQEINDLKDFSKQIPLNYLSKEEEKQ